MSTERSSLRLHKAGHDPRAAALVALSRTLREGADSQAALDSVLSSLALMPVDKRLCTEITYGVLRWYLRLKDFSESFLHRPDKLPDEMRLALITALYEMLFLRRPHHGPVNWAVNHVRNRFGTGLGGVANGALRSMQRKLADCNSPDLPLAARYAMPQWIVDLWMKSYGEAGTRALLEASQAAPPSGLRLNRAAPGWEALRESLLRENADTVHGVGAAALAFRGPLPWQARVLLKEGRAGRQSAASYEALQAFRPESWPLPLWDCCAGRGGKTLTLLEQGIPVALASDPSAHRLKALVRDYARLGLSCPPCPPIAAVAADMSGGQGGSEERSAPKAAGAAHSLAEHSAEETAPAAPPVFSGSIQSDSFGTVLVDAPCSGLGTLARRPEIRLRRTPRDLETLAARQRRILESVWSCLRSGGRLIYLTCTLNPAENEAQIAAFTANHANALQHDEFRTPFDSPLREFFYGALLEKR